MGNVKKKYRRYNTPFSPKGITDPPSVLEYLLGTSHLWIERVDEKDE